MGYFVGKLEEVRRERLVYGWRAIRERGQRVEEERRD